MGYFSGELFDFLGDLKKHNNKSWFDKNRGRFEEYLKQPILEFIEDSGPQLRKVGPVSGSMFRIYRDVRFSKDKSPYKTWAAVQFRHTAGKDVHAPGFYLHLDPEGCFIAAGMWHPEVAELRKIRESIVEKPAAWKTVRKKVTNLEGDSLVRPPQGFAHDHPLIDDIKRKDFITSKRIAQKQVCSDRFMATFIDECKQMNPLMKFLAQAVGVQW